MNAIKRPKQMDNETYSLLVGESYLNEDCLVMGEMFEDIMYQRGLEVTDEQAEFTMGMFHLWTSENSMNRPVIVNSPCGSGKSTMIDVFASVMAHNHENTFGCVIVKDKLEQIEATVHNINKTVGRQVAYGLQGYNPNLISKEDYQQQFKEQLEFPILVITQSMLNRKANAGNLESLATFYNEEGFKQRRTQLLIDEKPQLVSTFTFNEKTLHDLLLDVKKVTGGKGNQRFQTVFKQLRRKLENHDQQTSIMQPIQRS